MIKYLCNNKISRILSKIQDLFGEAAKSEYEHKLIRKLTKAKDQEKIFKKALANGEDVSKELEKVNSEILELINSLPYGDTPAFCTLCILWIITVLPTLLFYDGLQKIIYFPFYYNYKIGITTVVFILIVLWYIQKGFQMRYARALITFIAILGSSISIFSFFFAVYMLDKCMKK